MQIFINLIIVFILYLTLKVFLEGQASEATYVESYIDGNMYLVRNLPDKVAAADNIARIRSKLNKLIAHLKTSIYATEERVDRLCKNFKDDVLCESPVNSKHTSYSINKGEQIFFCLRQRDENNDLVDLNTITFVAMHELAHVMTKSIGHTTEFWDNFKFILQEAIKLDLYEYQAFHEKPVKYCGTLITSTPLKDS